MGGVSPAPVSSGSGRSRGDLPTGEAKAATVQGMFDRISGRYDMLNRTLTLGMDIGWRRRAVRSLGLPASSLVMDLACGTGDLCREFRTPDRIEDAAIAP